MSPQNKIANCLYRRCNTRATQGITTFLFHNGLGRTRQPVSTLCPKKRAPFYFSNDCQKLTDFNHFWCVKSWVNFTSIARTFAHLTCIL